MRQARRRVRQPGWQASPRQDSAARSPHRAHRAHRRVAEKPEGSRESRDPPEGRRQERSQRGVTDRTRKKGKENEITRAESRAQRRRIAGGAPRIDMPLRVLGIWGRPSDKISSEGPRTLSQAKSVNLKPLYKKNFPIEELTYVQHFTQQFSHYYEGSSTRDTLSRVPFCCDEVYCVKFLLCSNHKPLHNLKRLFKN